MLIEGFKEYMRQQRADGKWTFSAVEIGGATGRNIRGSGIYYNTLDQAIDGCNLEIKRILKQREAIKNRKRKS